MNTRAGSVAPGSDGKCALGPSRARLQVRRYRSTTLLWRRALGPTAALRLALHPDATAGSSLTTSVGRRGSRAAHTAPRLTAGRYDQEGSWGLVGGACLSPTGTSPRPPDRPGGRARRSPTARASDPPVPDLLRPSDAPFVLSSCSPPPPRLASPPRAPRPGSAWGVVTSRRRGHDGAWPSPKPDSASAAWAGDRVSRAACGGPRDGVLSFDTLRARALRSAAFDIYRQPPWYVGEDQGRDPALAPALAQLAASPWIELVPRVDLAPGAPADGQASDQVRCGPPLAAMASEEPGLSALRATLAGQVERLRAVSGIAPAAVAGRGAWKAPPSSRGASARAPPATHLDATASRPPRAPLCPASGPALAVVQAGARCDPITPVLFGESTRRGCRGGDRARLQPSPRLGTRSHGVRCCRATGRRLFPHARRRCAATRGRCRSPSAPRVP